MAIDTTILLSDRLYLRPMTRDDLALKVHWYSDPEINKTLILDEPLELEKTFRWFEGIQDSKTRLDLVIETSDRRPIGVIGLVSIDKSARSAEIFVVIGEREFWAKGVMLEAESLLIGWAFGTLGLQTIWAQARVENIASIITMKKLGFQIQESLRSEKQIDGQTVVILYLDLRRENFKPAHKKNPALPS